MTSYAHEIISERTAKSNQSLIQLGQLCLAINPNNKKGLNELSQLLILTYAKIIQILFETFFKLNEEALYWKSVSKGNLILYSLQTSPISSFNYIYSNSPSISSPLPLHYHSIFCFLPHLSTVSHFLTSFAPLTSKRREIGLRRNAIEVEKNKIAKMIGQLTLASARQGGLLESQDLKSSSSSLMEDTTRETTIDQLKLKIWSTLVTLDDTLSSSSTLRATGVPADLLLPLSHLFQSSLPLYGSSTSATLSSSQRPSFLTRAWPYIATIPFVSFIALRRLYDSRQTILDFFANARSTITSFLIDWVAEPLLKIIETIGHKEGGQLMMSRESLKSEVASLERMVIEFSRDQLPGLASDSLLELGAAAKEGNLTTVMTAFEKDIKNPIRSVIAGSLLRTVLIQVQKSKVDLALAMDGIENMLSSQQLTFAFVGVAPSIIIVVGCAKWVKGFWQTDGRTQKAKKESRRRIFATLRHLDSIISNSAELTLEHREMQGGYLLLELQSLRTYAYSSAFPSRDTEIRDAYLNDVRALEECGGREKDDSRVSDEMTRRLLLKRLWRWRNELRDEDA